MIKRKLLSMACAAFMGCSCILSPMTAFAAQTGSISFSDGLETDSYEIYRLLNAATSSTDGTYDEGDALTYTINSKYRTILQTLTSQTDDADIIAAIADMNASEIAAFAKNAYTAIDEASLEPEFTVSGDDTQAMDYGYYLIKDVSSNSAAMSDNVITSVVKGDVEVTTKKDDAPTLTKKIVDGGSRVDAVVAEIGSLVEFEIQASIPENGGEDSYIIDTFVIHDELSANLSTPEAVTVKIGEDVLTPVDDYTFSTSSLDDSCSFEININKAALQGKDGETVTVTYSCEVEDSAVIGSSGNDNIAFLEYDNDPNSNTTHETAHDQVKVYSLQLDVTKENEEGAKLPNAEFKLFRDASCENEIKLTKDPASNEYTVDPSGSSTIKTDDTGIFSIIGLSEGTYYLKETVPPSGYALPTDAIKLDVVPDVPDEIASGTEQLAALEATGAMGESQITVSADATTGVMGLTVVNHDGVRLPETGGMGTYVFYAAGAVIMIAAGVCVVVKRKKN